MPNQEAALDTVFRALADPTRRAVVQRLSRGPASVTELAEPFEMALPSFLQHLKVLEGSGLVRSKKSGRVRTFEIAPEQLAVAEHWIGKQREIWAGRLDRLEDVIKKLKAGAAVDGQS
ncbi:MAG: metalloregulator ArsR/SmtB family transcription factor [Alphaproteobacteria bacterium]|nr:metalloregulator ArsR/SmtB family transcription factor [Alphaproteobacteria bacterium]